MSSLDSEPPDTAAEAAATAPVSHPGSDAGLRHAAHALLTRGNHLARDHDNHTLTLHAGVGQRHAAGLPCACLEHAGTHLLVALEHESGPPAPGDAHWSDYDGEARTLAWTLANEALLDSLGQLFGNPLLATGLQSGGGSDHLWLAFDFKEDGGRRLEGWLGIGEAEARRLMEQPEWQNDPAYLPLLGDATSLDLELWLPGPILSARDRAATVVGDVLLLDTAHDPVAEVRPTPEAGHEVLGLPDAWAARHHEGQWLLAERDLLGLQRDSGRFHFRLTCFRMALESLGRLKPGARLTHDPLLPGKHVDIMLDNRCRAEGTLVALGTRLGVCIVQHEGEHGFQ